MHLKELVDRYQTAMNTVYRGVNNILKEKVHSDLTTDQFSTLQYIQNHTNCTSTEIAQAFGIGKSAVTAQINRLEAKAFIERTRDQEDRRNVYLTVTEKGAALIDYTEERLFDALSKHMAHFKDDEIQTFIRLLEELAFIMEQDGVRREKSQ